jgi:hypothetical protein
MPLGSSASFSSKPCFRQTRQDFAKNPAAMRTKATKDLQEALIHTAKHMAPKLQICGH